MKKVLASLSLLALPMLAGAQQIVTSAGSVRDAKTLFDKINSILNAIIPILISFAVVYLIYAIVMYVIAGDEDQKKGAKTMILYGIVGLFIILSIWGLVNILVNTFGLNNQIPRDKIPSVLPINQNV